MGGGFGRECYCNFLTIIFIDIAISNGGGFGINGLADNIGSCIWVGGGIGSNSLADDIGSCIRLGGDIGSGSRVVGGLSVVGIGIRGAVEVCSMYLFILVIDAFKIGMISCFGIILGILGLGVIVGIILGIILDIFGIILGINLGIIGINLGLIIGINLGLILGIFGVVRLVLIIIIMVEVSVVLGVIVAPILIGWGTPFLLCALRPLALRPVALRRGLLLTGGSTEGA